MDRRTYMKIRFNLVLTQTFANNYKHLPTLDRVLWILNEIIEYNDQVAIFKYVKVLIFEGFVEKFIDLAWRGKMSLCWHESKGRPQDLRADSTERISGK